MLLDSFSILFCIQRFGTGRNGLYRYLTVILYRCAAALCALGGDDDHTVCTACTVDCSCGTILEHVDGLDLLEVDGPHVSSGYAIDDDERSLSCHEGICTTEENLERCIRVTSVRIGHSKTCNLSLEHSCR